MCGRDEWVHHVHQVLQVAEGGVQRQEEEGHQVHTGHRLYKGTKGTVCSGGLRVQGGRQIETLGCGF